MNTPVAHQVTETLTPATRCPLSGYPRITRTRSWIEFRVRCEYTDGESPIDKAINRIDATSEGALAAAQAYAVVVRRVVPHLDPSFARGGVRLSRVHRVESTVEVIEACREDYDDRLAAGEFDNMVECVAAA